MPILISDKGYYIVISGQCGITYFDEENNEFILDSEMINEPLYNSVVS